MDFLFGAGLAIAVLLVMLALWRLFPPAWRVARGTAPFLSILLTFLLACASTVFGREVALLAAAMALAFVAPVLLRRAKHAQALERALAKLDDPREREKSRVTLFELAGPPPEWRYVRWARIAQYVASRAARAGCHEEALRLAERIDPMRLEEVDIAARAQVMAACCLALRDRRRAREILACVRRPVSVPMWERALLSLEVLADALDGNATNAEPMARDRLARETEPVLQITWRMAHAHALAALDRREEALAALRELRDSVPDQRVLERVARHGGPASPLAEWLMGDAGAVYR